MVAETKIDRQVAIQLVELGRRLRKVEGHDIEEQASTRLLVHTVHLINDGLSAYRACEVALVDSLTDDFIVRDALLEIVDAYFTQK